MNLLKAIWKACPRICLGLAFLFFICLAVSCQTTASALEEEFLSEAELSSPPAGEEQAPADEPDKKEMPAYGLETPEENSYGTIPEDSVQEPLQDPPVLEVPAEELAEPQTEAMAFAGEFFVDDQETAPEPAAQPEPVAQPQAAAAPREESRSSQLAVTAAPAPQRRPSEPSPVREDIPAAEPPRGEDTPAGVSSVLNDVRELTRHWEVEAHGREPRELVLEGGGWVLVDDNGGLDFRITRYPGTEQTRFVFLFPVPGEGQLRFFQQDLYKGSQADLNLFVTVLPARQDAVSGESSRPETSRTIAVDEPSWSAPENTAELSPLDGAPDGSAESAAGEAPVKADFESALAEGNSAFFERHWKDFLPQTQAGDAPFLFQVHDFLSAQGLESAANDNAARLAGFQLPEYLRDELYIRLGRFYQNSAAFRDEKKALQYYELLVKECPASKYWDEANRQSRYLQRHYFRIY